MCVFLLKSVFTENFQEGRHVTPKASAATRNGAHALISQNMSSDDPQREPHCPVGEQSCSWLDELVKLRGRVDRLEELVSHDPLTNLYNVRHFQQTLPVVMERTRRTQRPASLIMVDLDHFKKINDTWGHEVGNVALKQTASILCQQVRIVDTVCRYGGEEFIIVLPDTGLRPAIRIAERIRNEIAEKPVRHDRGEFHMTASMGVEVHLPGDERSAEELIDSVDRLLYRAKESGRNRVCHADMRRSEKDKGITADERKALHGLFQQED